MPLRVGWIRRLCQEADRGVLVVRSDPCPRPERSRIRGAESQAGAGYAEGVRESDAMRRIPITEVVMRSRKVSPLLVPILGLLLLLPSRAFSGGTPGRASDVSSEGAAETLVATVCSCDPEAKTMHLLRGCGRPLRAVKRSVPSGTRRAGKGQTLPLPDVKPGRIVGGQ